MQNVDLLVMRALPLSELIGTCDQEGAFRHYVTNKVAASRIL